MATNEKMVNAWMLLAEDEPAGTDYTSPNSCYQTLITNHVYRAVDVLFLCFVNTVPAADGQSSTLQIDPAAHPNGLTNDDYLRFVIRDAQADNPNIRIAVTLDYNTNPPQSGATTISQIFSNQAVTPEQNAANFAANVVAYLQSYGLDGFDIDWESPLSEGTTQEQLALVVDALGEAFAPHHYLLTISPAVADNLDATAINANVAFLNLQLYSGFTQPSAFQAIGINPQLFAYGAKFESGAQTAQQAFTQNLTRYHYPIFTCWRLNSSNYTFEQQQQLELYRLVFAAAAGSKERLA